MQQAAISDKVAILLFVDDQRGCQTAVMLKLLIFGKIPFELCFEQFLLFHSLTRLLIKRPLWVLGAFLSSRLAADSRFLSRQGQLS